MNPNLSYNKIISTLEKSSLLKRNSSQESKEGSLIITAHDAEAQEKSCFILFKAFKRNSAERLYELCNKKVSLIIIDDPKLFEEASKKTHVLLVRSSRAAWFELCSSFFNHPQKNLKLIGITGTNGKTSTAWILSQVLKNLGEKAAYIGTLGNGVDETISFPHTTPDPPVLLKIMAQAAQKKFKYLALEISSHALIQEKIYSLRFSSLIFTSFGRDHLDFHKTEENYLQAKLSLFSPEHQEENTSLFAARKLAHFLPKEFCRKKNLFFYGKNKTPVNKEKKNLLYELEEETLQNSTLSFTSNEKKHHYSAPYLGENNAENLFVSLMCAQTLTGKLPQENKLKLEQIPGRLERVKTRKDFLIFIDYAHTPEAIEGSLKELKRLAKGKIHLIFGCGGDRDKGKRPLMAKAAEEFSDRITVTEDNPRSERLEDIFNDIKKGFDHPEKVSFIKNRELAIHTAMSSLKAGDILLLSGKGHENYQERNSLREDFSEKKIIQDYKQERKT